MSSPRESRDIVNALTHRDHSANPTESVEYNITRGRNDLYTFTSLPYNQRDIVRRQGDILGPLSLFAPYANEEYIEEDDLVRPVTPIGDEIKGPASTFKQLSTYVLRRIKADKNMPYLDIEDQEGLAGVLLGELNGIWTELHRLADDPFISREANRELKRLMVVRIVEICSDLFKQYIEKAQIINRRGVFTGPANVSRLKAQLGLDAHRLLNVCSVRRWAVEMLREDSSDADGELDDKLSAKVRVKTPRRHKSRKPEVPSVRPSPRKRSPRKQPTIQDELNEMEREMPDLRTDKLISVLEDMDQLGGKPLALSESVHIPDQPSVQKLKSAKRYRPRRSRSVDETNRDENLSVELEIDIPAELARSDSTHLINMPCLIREPTVVKPAVEPDSKRLRDDLNNLIAKPKADDVKDEIDDMPPLLQAITKNAKHDGRKERLRKQMEELDRREAEYIERTQVRQHQPPTFPQPDTVTSKLPNKMEVRTSDVRVSERICLSSFTIDKNGPLYNDLTSEVDPATVKMMDRNLFMGDEIKEVYQEIMKTIPTDHLTLSNDALVVPAADSVNIASILMPSGLQNRKQQKIVNKSLQKSTQPPWRHQNILTWAKTPVTQLKEVKADSFGSSRRPEENDPSNIPGMILSLEEYKEQLVDCPRQMQERLGRNYQSWLTWWKTTVSTEDYQKYLASQETDYLGYMFHYYDSDGEDDDGLSGNANGKSTTTHSAAGTTAAERQKMEELRAQKNEYKPGFWNPCSVLMGGLGKDPVLEEDNLQTPRSDVTQSSHMNVGKRIRLKSDFSAHSLRSTESELSKTILNKLHESMAEAQRIEEEKHPSGPSPQDRLEKVWTTLRMPDHQKLDMAIKYSADKYIDLLERAIDAWENATDLIMDREKLMYKLENFERLASDPNRFFEKGIRGSSVARLDEAKQRSHYYKKLDEMEVLIGSVLTKIEDDFDDKVSLEGRPYLEKMHWDRIEMLFWLQEERKQHVIEKHSIAKGMTLGLGRIESNLQTA